MSQIISLYDYLDNKYGSYYNIMNVFIIEAYFSTNTIKDFDNKLNELKKYSFIKHYDTQHLKNELFNRDGTKRFIE